MIYSTDSWKCSLEKKSALERDLAISLAKGRLKPSELGVKQGCPGGAREEEGTGGAAVRLARAKGTGESSSSGAPSVSRAQGLFRTLCLC